MQKSRDLARRVSLVGLLANGLLCLMKLAVGLLAGSGALISDAVNSATDVLSTLIALIGIRLGKKQADPEHPYGHERFECVASLVLAGIVFVSGAGIGWSGLQAIYAAIRGNAAALAAPGAAALAAALICCGVKEALYRYTIRAARQLDSVALKASAWDHRSDVFSSLGVFAGILGARLGLPVLDAVASVVISLLVLRVALSIFREAVGKTVDRACAPEIEEKLRAAALAQPGVRAVDLLLTRQCGAGVYVDLEIAVDGALSLSEAHAISEAVHDAVEASEPTIRHCMVHVNPSAPPREAEDSGEDLRREA